MDTLKVVWKRILAFVLCLCMVLCTLSLNETLGSSKAAGRGSESSGGLDATGDPGTTGDLEPTGDLEVSGSLVVTKTVTGTAGEKDKEWNFKVELSDTTVNGTYGEMDFYDGIASFTLRDGESMTATGLTPGITYTVTEEESGQNWYTTTVQEDGGDTGDDAADGKGTILADSTGNLIFTNNREGGNLEVTKTVTGTAGEMTKDWNFTVTLSDKSISGTYGEMEFKDGSASFTLKHGQTKTAENLPAGVTYTVTEKEANSDDYSTTQSGNAGIIPANGTATAEFTNSRSLKTGSLTVKKTVAGNDGELEKLWNFTVELSDKAVNGTYGDMTFTNGSASFTLKHNETKTAENLPAGVTYTVTESEANRGGYSTSFKNNTGTIPANGTASAEFTNMRSKSQKTETTPGADVPVEDGDEVTYQISYENASTDAMKIVITDPLDEGVDFVEASDGGKYDAATRTVTWTLENVPAGTQSQVSLTVKVNAKAVKGDDQIENQATVKFGNQPEVKTEKVANPVETGGLTVKKTVQGNAGDKNKYWNFTVELSDKTINGTYGNMTFVSGVASFTLKHGEKKVAKELPAGVTYTVTEQEANQDGYTTIQSGSTGMIPEEGTVSAEFTNYKSEPHKTETSPGAGKAVGVGDTVTYQISYENASTGAMKIVITDPLDDGVDYVTSSDQGQYNPVTRTVTWTLENVPAGTNGQVTLTVKVNAKAETGGKQIKNQASVKFGNRSEVTTEEIKNPVETGSLTVKKTVTGDAGRKDANWNFTVELSDKTITGIYGDMEFTEGVAEVTLKDGESKTAKGLRAGITYTVTEKEANQNGYTTAKTGEEGEIISGGEAVAEFTNDRHVPNKTETDPGPDEPVRVGEVVTYQISYDNLGDTPITITIKDKLDEGVDFVDASDSGKYDAATRTVTWTLENVPALTVEPKFVTLRVKVNAQAVDGDQKIENKATVRYGNGPDIETNTIQNPVETGGLTVRKTVKGNAGDKTADWNFTVELSDKTIQGTYGDMIFDKGVASFALKDGESKTAEGLPAGVTYTVTEKEADQDGYVTDRSGEKGTIPDKNIAAEAQFTNYKSEPHKIETKPGANMPVEDGDEVTYQITYENASTEFMKIVITDTLDDGVDYVTSSDGGKYDPATRTVTWTLENVPAGTQSQVTLTVKVNAKAVKDDDQIENQATVKFGNQPEVKTEKVANPVETGGLTVRKAVKGNAGDKTADWNFTVELSDKTIDGIYGDMEFKGGVAEFTLKDGGFKTARGLPAGVGYTVTEAEAGQNGYVTNQSGEKGTIPDKKTAEAQFTNYRSVPHKTETSPGAGKAVGVGDTVTYQISYENASTGTMKIVITDPLDDGVDYVTSSDQGQYDPATRTVTWTLENVPAGTNGQVTLTVKVNAKAETGGKQIKNQASVKFGNRSEVTTEEITNPVETGSLTVKKTVTGDAGRKDADWNFTVELSDKTITGIYGDMEFTEGVAEFMLKSGEHKTATGLRAGIAYTVTEKEANQKGYRTAKTGEEGEILSGREASAEFTNDRHVPNKTETDPGPDEPVRVGEVVTYQISYDNLGDTPITITIKDKLDEGVDFVDASDGGQYDPATRTVTWTLENVPALTVEPEFVTLRVSVNANALKDDKQITNQATVRYGNGPDIETDIIRNPVETGNLTVKKTVTGGAGDRNKDWNFTVELSDKTIQGTYGDMTFDKGVASFTLKDGESKTAKGLPAGVTYTVTEAEANQDGYITSWSGQEGTISANGKEEASFTNFKSEPHKTETSPGAGKTVGVGDEITYRISYENAGTDAMTIIITDPLDEGVDFVRASDDGQYDAATHTVTWTLKDVPAGTVGPQLVTLTVRVNAKAAAGDERIENQAFVKFGNQSAVSTEKVTNSTGTGSLTVRKTVTGDAGRKDADWHFKVELSDKTITGTYGDMDFVEGIAEFTLKHGERKTASDLPAGVTYTVTEKEANQNGYTTAKTGEKGEIISETEAIAEFTNDRHVPNKTELDPGPGEPVRIGEEVTYQISYDNKGDTPITITIKDKLDEGVDFVDASDGGQYDPATRTVTWTLTVPAGTVEPQLVTLLVRVNAQAADGDQKIENKATVQYGSGPEIETDTIQNPVETGSLTVKKTVTGGAGDRNKNWNFTVELSDKTIQGTYGDMTFDKGVASFTLKDGESKTAKGLPAGVTYTVTEKEANQDGYTTSCEGETGVIPTDEEAVAGFTNFKPEPNKPETPPPENKKDEPEKSSPKTDGDAPFVRYVSILLSGTILLTGVYALRRRRKRR